MEEEKYSSVINEAFPEPDWDEIDPPMKGTDPVGELLTFGAAAATTAVAKPLVGALGVSNVIDAGLNMITGESDTAFEKKLELFKPAKVAVKSTRIFKDMLTDVFDRRVERADPVYAMSDYRKVTPNPIWDNLSEKVQNQFTDAGIDSDKAKFFIENWNREVGASVEGFPYTNATFDFMKGELLPKVLEDLKDIDLSDGLQLDHIAQLKAMTPFYKGRNLKQSEKIRRILIKEGIFGGHNPKNLKYLPTDVHTVKTNFWKQNVGDAGEKFFEGRPMRTYADVEKAAKEMKNFINRSNNIVETVSAQYKFMRKKKISAEELDKLLKKVDLNYGTYNLKEIRKLIKEDINVDKLSKSKQGLEDAQEAAEAVEHKEKKTYLPHEIEDVDPADIPTKKRVRKKKSTLQKMAEDAAKAEEKRLKKLGGQKEIDLDE